ncbi:4'-phosphopantetheinyl transferase superfamily protein [Staphylococcus saccharolyticus]|uniref:4'-phosphopantetheinyl transferase n=1 Tax=Staphylococcus saccharolyticus TaxID=33028 RepID=A0A380JAI2_9STAP|nr:4'-phosphopantetheinyl transferase superfamily protein [Staphylococcus saccharolyticus]MBL7566128.1 4'-phosphopantetheinyl transferase superfamily protein [Staphylococcus saccharolyticus]MBL7571686.1 4'-phosphopantetheinyl transferase superfamily protein [Staphylococcus saccharolyticus]QRJ67565.1 4'-phosphopantetheinyl transferase superfamily protein [Staphylococcus saccharolyticus]RTX97653.1 4-phosphopantetheinyl transferase family protein [Staphylococcus saccharolyticus]TAA98118.1 hypothe
MGEKIVGIGIDICEVDKMRKLFFQFTKQELSLIFTEKELNYIELNKMNLFILFSLKESLTKALGIGFNSKLSELKKIEFSLNGNYIENVSVKENFSEILHEKNVILINSDFTITRNLIITKVLLIGDKGV